jgi:hypothetical protein
MADQADGKTATIPVQTAETPSTNPKQNVDDENKTSTNNSPSSIGARTKARVRKATTQSDVGPAPVGEHSPIDKKMGGMHNGSDKPAEPTEKAPSEPAKTSKLEKKIPDAPAEITRPVANVAGKAKTPGTSDDKKTVSEQILHKLAKSRPESKPQTGTSKPKKAEKTNTSQTHETDAGDSDEIIITHDGTKQAPTEPANPNMKRRHTTVSKPAIVYEYKEANKTPQIPLERNKDATQPTRPVTKTKPQSMIPPLPPPSEVPQSPLKKAAVTHRMTNGEPEFAVIQYKNADTTSLRQKTSHEMTKLDQGRVKTSSKRHRSHTGTPSNSDEDLGDLRGMLNERHDRRKNKTLEESQRSVKVVYENRSKPYNASSRQYGHNTDHKGSSVKS